MLCVGSAEFQTFHTVVTVCNDLLPTEAFAIAPHQFCLFLFCVGNKLTCRIFNKSAWSQIKIPFW